MLDTRNQPRSDWHSTRFWLAIGVTVISVVAVSTLAGLIIHYSKDGPNAATNAQNVLNSVLPLLGTWVGTILAYYFSKENFEAATKSVTALAKQISPQEKLRSALAGEKMIHRQEMFVQMVSPEKLKISEMLKSLEDAGKGSRIPILGPLGEPIYVLHRSMVDKFMADSVRSGKTTDEVLALTVADLFAQSNNYEKIAQSFGCISPEATLADALSIMTNLDGCQDVFVTEVGSKSSPVVGWITNGVIQNNAVV